jgi:hypothetical protein
MRSKRSRGHSSSVEARKPGIDMGSKLWLLSNRMADCPPRVADVGDGSRFPAAGSRSKWSDVPARNERMLSCPQGLKTLPVGVSTGGGPTQHLED